MSNLYTPFRVKFVTSLHALFFWDFHLLNSCVSVDLSQAKLGGISSEL